MQCCPKKENLAQDLAQTAYLSTAEVPNRRRAARNETAGGDVSFVFSPNLFYLTMATSKPT